MKFSTQTLEILDNYSRISKGLFFAKGKQQMTMTSGRTVFSEVTIDEDIPQDFGIYNLKNFLQILSLFASPEINFQGQDIVVSEGDKKVTYRACEKSLIKTPKQSLSNIIKDFKVSFTLDKNMISDIIRAAPVLNATDFIVVGDGKKVSVIVKNSSEGTDTFVMDICDNPEEFRSVISLKSTDLSKPLDMLPHDYDVYIAENAIKFSSLAMNLNYWYTIQNS